MKTRQVGRWVLIAAGGALGLVVLFRVGLGIYLNTGAGKAFVGRQITARIGMPTEVTRVRFGLFTSTIGLKVYDPAAPDPSKAEVFQVESADADVTLFGLATGNIAPKTVELKNVNLQLHVSADGKVLTTLPNVPEGGGGGALPTVKLSGGRVTIRQDGRPEFALTGIDATVTPDGERVKLAGTIDDPLWSKWTVGGDIDQSAKTGSVELATSDGPLTMDRLGSVPFVPPSVWRHITANGRGAAVVKLWAGSDHEVHYSVDIRPKAADLTLPDADVTLKQVTGLIRVSGAKVELKDTKAALASGTFAADGVVDFGPEPTTADLKVSAEGLDVKQLPPEWGLPKDIEGKLRSNGPVTLSMKFHSDGRIETDGGGSGEIVGAKIRGIPITFKVELRSDGERYRFDKPMQTGLGRADERELVFTSPLEGEVAGTVLRSGGWGVSDARREVAQRPNHATPATRRSPPTRDCGDAIATSPSRGEVKTSARPVTKCAQPAKQPADPKPKDAPTTLDATIALRDIDIAELLQKLDVKIGYKVSGKVTAELTLAVPLESAASSSAYEFTGKVSSPALTLEGLTVRDLSAKATYKNGKLTLSELKGAIQQPGDPKAAPGTFRGTATAAVDPAGDVTATLTLDAIPLGEVLKAVPGFAVDVRGVVSGKATLKAPYDKLSDPTAVTGSADLTSQELVLAGRAAKGAKLSVGVDKGTATLRDLSATVEGIPVTATGTVELGGKYVYATTIKTTGTDVADLRRLVPELELPAPVEGVLTTTTRVTGTVSPLTYTASGTISATKLTLAKTPANALELSWEVTADRFLVKSLKADVFGGTLTGSADVPFGADKGGQFDLTAKEFDVAAATPLIPDFPVRIAGRVSGTVKGKIAPAKEGQSRVGNLDIDLTAPKLTVQGIPAERLVGKADVKGGVLFYSLEGKTLGGSFDLKGRYPGAKKGAAPAPAREPQPEEARAGWGNEVELAAAFATARVQPKGKDRGSFRLTGADLSRVAGAFGLQSLSPLRGRLDVTFDFDDDLSNGSGRITLSGLQWGNARFARDVVAVVVLRNGILEVADVSGSVAGGTLRGRARVYLNNTERNFFSLTVSGAEAKRLFALVPQLGSTAEGPISLTVRGRFGREMRGSGMLTMERGTLAGIAVAGLRVPFDWATTPGGYGRFAVRDAALSAGSGNLTANLTAEWGVEMRVDGLIKMVNVPLRAIAPSVGDFALLGNGRITGRFDLVGRNVRSVDDLSGTLLATLGNTSPREVPIIQQAVPFLNTAGLAKPFETGDVRGTLSRGVFRVQRLTLVSPSAQLFAEGNITLSGRVDMNVIAHTGTIGPEARGLRLLGLRLPAIGPIPVGLLRDLGDFLSNRTVRLSITGTVRDPQVKVNIGALVTEQAARFFLSRYIPVDAAAALGLGAGFGSITGDNK